MMRKLGRWLWVKNLSSIVLYHISNSFIEHFVSASTKRFETFQNGLEHFWNYGYNEQSWIPFISGSVHHHLDAGPLTMIFEYWTLYCHNQWVEGSINIEKNYKWMMGYCSLTNVVVSTICVPQQSDYLSQWHIVLKVWFIACRIIYIPERKIRKSLNFLEKKCTECLEDLELHFVIT